MITKKRTLAKVFGQFEAIHCWKDSPKPDIYHLSNPHRHMFYVKVFIQQNHTDRDVEFYAFKQFLKELLINMPKQLYYSCEDYSDQIAELINKEYPNRYLMIEVTEDDKEGSVSTYDAH